jgi:hypothetical protein
VDRRRAGAGQAREPDPDELVELETASVADAPLIVAALEAEGIGARSVESFDPVTAVTRTKVVVRRADLPAAIDARRRLR